MAQILVVDDEVGIRELLSEILRDEGHEIRLAENAAEARRARESARPDLVLLDIWMPDTDGITLLKEWNPAGQLTMPVVMMSGHGTIDTAVEATRIGAMDFLEKPIGMQKLLAAVKRALEQAPRPGAAALFAGRLPALGAKNFYFERLVSGDCRMQSRESKRVLLLLTILFVAFLFFSYWYMMGCEGNWRGQPLETKVELIEIKRNMESDIDYLQKLGPRNSENDESYKQLRQCKEWIRKKWESQGYVVTKHTFSSSEKRNIPILRSKSRDVGYLRK